MLGHSKDKKADTKYSRNSVRNDVGRNGIRRQTKNIARGFISVVTQLRRTVDNSNQIAIAASKSFTTLNRRRSLTAS